MWPLSVKAMSGMDWRNTRLIVNVSINLYELVGASSASEETHCMQIKLYADQKATITQAMQQLSVSV